MATYDKHAEAGHGTAASSNGSHDMVEDLNGKLGYGEERDAHNRADIREEDNPNVYPHVGNTRASCDRERN